MLTAAPARTGASARGGPGLLRPEPSRRASAPATRMDGKVDAPTSGRHGVTALHAARLACDVCGEETVHRIVQATSDRDGTVRGIARCRVCRWTHPFVSVAPRTMRLPIVVSDGPSSVRRTVEVDPTTRITVGERVGDPADELIVRRIEVAAGRAARSAAAPLVRTLWAVPDRGARVPVSIVEGRRTRPTVLILPPSTRLGVGASVNVEGMVLEVVAIRARGHTWRRPGDEFAAGEIVRLYTRRAVKPPAGRSDWSRSRGSPSSRARATSLSARRRSSPGVRTTRTSPPRRSASSGATVQTGSPSIGVVPRASSAGRSLR